jgi:hypothetical protein
LTWYAVQAEVEALVRYLNTSGEMGEIVELGDDDPQVFAIVAFVKFSHVYRVVAWYAKRILLHVCTFEANKIDFDFDFDFDCAG